MLIYRNHEGQSVNVPFVFGDGQLPEAVDYIADYITVNDLGNHFWESVAAERLGVILRQQVALSDAYNQLRAVSHELEAARKGNQ